MTTLRTHFTFRVDTWTPDGESIVEHVVMMRLGRASKKRMMSNKIRMGDRL
jgi:hypothetical protein